MAATPAMPETSTGDGLNKDRGASSVVSNLPQGSLNAHAHPGSLNVHMHATTTTTTNDVDATRPTNDDATRTYAPARRPARSASSHRSRSHSSGAGLGRVILPTTALPPAQSTKRMATGGEDDDNAPRSTRRRHPASPNASCHSGSPAGSTRQAFLERSLDEMRRQNAEDRMKAEANAREMEARLVAMIEGMQSVSQVKDSQLAEASRVTDLLRAEVNEAGVKARARDEQARSELHSQEVRLKAEAERRHSEAVNAATRRLADEHATELDKFRSELHASRQSCIDMSSSPPPACPACPIKDAHIRDLSTQVATTRGELHDSQRELQRARTDAKAAVESATIERDSAISAQRTAELALSSATQDFEQRIAQAIADTTRAANEKKGAMESQHAAALSALERKLEDERAKLDIERARSKARFAEYRQHVDQVDQEKGDLSVELERLKQDLASRTAGAAAMPQPAVRDD